MNTKLWIAAGLTTLVALAGCEKKEPTTPTAPSTTTGTGEKIKDAAKSAGEAVKDTTIKAADAVKDTASKAADKVTEAWAKSTAAMKGYIDDVNKTTGVLAGVKDAPSATAALPKLKDLSAAITAKAGALTALSPDDQTKLRAEFKDQLAAAVKGLRAEIDRVSKDPGAGTVVGDVARNIKLFE